MKYLKISILLTIFIIFLVVKPVFGAPYRPPPPPPPAEKPKDEPLPLPEPPEPDNRSPDEPRDTPIPPPPTPTPCIPNFCFFQQTICCFDSLCIFHGETEKGGNPRCLKLSPDDKTNLFQKITQSTQSLIGMFISGISSIFGK